MRFVCVGALIVIGITYPLFDLSNRYGLHDAPLERDRRHIVQLQVHLLLQTRKYAPKVQCVRRDAQIWQGNVAPQHYNGGRSLGDAQRQLDLVCTQSHLSPLSVGSAAPRPRVKGHLNVHSSGLGQARNLDGFYHKRGVEQRKLIESDRGGELARVHNCEILQIPKAYEKQMEWQKLAQMTSMYCNNMNRRYRQSQHTRNVVLRP